jgi:hypothetical protein
MYIVASADCAQREVERRNTNNKKSLNKKQKKFSFKNISALQSTLRFLQLQFITFFGFHEDLLVQNSNIKNLRKFNLSYSSNANLFGFHALLKVRGTN